MSKSLNSLCNWLKANSKLLAAIGNWTGLSPTGVTLWVERAQRRDRGQLWLMDQSRQCLLGRLPVRLDGAVVDSRYEGFMEIRLTGPGTAYAASDYGAAGIVVCDRGRANLVIHGGDRRPTAGPWTAGIRLQAADMQSLVIALESIESPVTCQIVKWRESQSNWDDDRDRTWDDQDRDRFWNDDESSVHTEPIDEAMPDQHDQYHDGASIDDPADCPTEPIAPEYSLEAPPNGMDDGYC